MKYGLDVRDFTMEKNKKEVTLVHLMCFSL